MLPPAHLDAVVDVLAERDRRALVDRIHAHPCQDPALVHLGVGGLEMAAYLFQPIPAYPRTEKVLQPTPAAFIAFRINVFSQTFSGRRRPCRCTPAALRHRRCLDTWMAKCALPIRARQAGQHALPSPIRCARMVSQECCRGQFSRACSRPGIGPCFVAKRPGARIRQATREWLEDSRRGQSDRATRQAGSTRRRLRSLGH